MDPITLSILVGAAGTAASQAGNLIPSSLEREQKKELEKLKRRQEAGTLGLTEQERAILDQRLSGASEVAGAQAAQERARLLAGGGGVQGGQQLSQAVALEEQRQKQEERIATAVEEQDALRRRQEESRIHALEAARAEASQKRVAAAGAIAGASIEAAATTAAQQKLIQGARAPSPESVNALAQQLDISPDEARGFIELSVTNPDLLHYMTMMRAGQKRGF